MLSPGEALADILMGKAVAKTLYEPGIRRGNEDSHRNINRKSRNNLFFVGKKIDKHTFFSL